MRIALCTTTIHVPHALKLLRRCGHAHRFFVAVDENTPPEVHRYVSEIENAQHYYHGDGNWKCSKAIGFRTLARRNIAFLEALAWGADIIVSHDDDNIPLDIGYFAEFENNLMFAHDGIKVTGTDRLHGSGHGAVATQNWFDPGTLLIPATRHRGYPYNLPISKRASPVTGAKVGVSAGLVIGDPDIDATTRMELRPDIGQVHILGQTGIVVDPHTWTVFNSQNTAVIRELVPAWFMMPGVGRHDDIYASLIVQRVARDRGYHVHFGPPFTYQQRNEHNLITDLRAEIDGMENVEKLAELLDIIDLPAKSVIEDTRIIYENLADCDFIPEQAVKAALMWLTDCETVL